jgi:hypothetical protein
MTKVWKIISSTPRMGGGGPPLKQYFLVATSNQSAALKALQNRRPDVEASQLTVAGETNTDNLEWQWLDLQEGRHVGANDYPLGATWGRDRFRSAGQSVNSVPPLMRVVTDRYHPTSSCALCFPGGGPTGPRGRAKLGTKDCRLDSPRDAVRGAARMGTRQSRWPGRRRLCCLSICQ